MTEYLTELTDKNFKDFTKSGIALVDIKSSWCYPCKMMEPIIDDISNEYHSQIKIGKMDTDSNVETVNLLDIRSVPTFIIYKDGQIVERYSGFTTKEKLKEALKKHIPQE